MQTLILSKYGGESELRAALQKVSQHYFGEDFLLLSPVRADEERIESIQVGLEEETEIKEVIKGRSLKRLVLLGFARQETISLTLLVDMISCGIEAIDGLYEDEISRYAPFKEEQASTLLIFPGAMLPLNMGSHQRSFLLLAALNYSGYPTDVIITGGDPRSVSRSRRLLLAIAPNVYVYKNNKRKLPDYLWLRREAERIYRKRRLDRNDVPELFADRYANKATESLKKTMVTLQQEKQYKNIIVSYAWMSRSLDYLPKDALVDVKLICDTHDVQYMRNASSNKEDKRFLAFAGADKWLEKRVLSRYHYILAISKSDAEELKKTKPLARKVLLVTNAFDYALKKPRKISHKTVLNFGFIGGGMEANVKALEYILRHWWPLMSAYSPESKLYIAGSICKKESIVEATFFDESVVKLGFVDNLSSFYDRIDIALNTVLVQGGLNFKSVEAVLAGKLLITNSLGARCLGEGEIASIADSPEEFLDILKELELMDVSEAESLLKNRQAKAMEEFGERMAYHSLKQVLSL